MLSHWLSWRVVQATLLSLGLVTLVGLLYQVGPMRIYMQAAEIGLAGIGMILLPSTVMYFLDCAGWRMALGAQASAVSFFRLFMIRTAGEVVNATTPTGYVGGEPVKAYLLARYGISLVDGLASVIIGKTTMTIAQVAYIVVGIVLGLWLLLSPHNLLGGPLVMIAALTSLGLVIFGIMLFVVVQRRGLFTVLFAMLRTCRWQIAPLEARREKLFALDQAIGAFYSRAKGAVLLSTAAFLLGWLMGAMEVYLLLHYLGAPVDLLTALSIDALSTLVKGATFVVPGSVGAQEAGTLMLVTAYGHDEVVGMTVALLRRLRELVWITIGIVCLVLLGSGVSSTEEASN